MGGPTPLREPLVAVSSPPQIRGAMGAPVGGEARQPLEWDGYETIYETNETIMGLLLGILLGILPDLLGFTRI